MSIELSAIKPFEICSIRPPTENYSLTFRLTRNCYWNRCGFCPAYKFGTRFSKRRIEEVKEDIKRAKLIDELMFEHGIGNNFSPDMEYGRAAVLFERIKRSSNKAGEKEQSTEKCVPDDLDPGLAWFLSWFKEKPMLQVIKEVKSTNKNSLKK